MCVFIISFRLPVIVRMSFLTSWKIICYLDSQVIFCYIFILCILLTSVNLTNTLKNKMPMQPHTRVCLGVSHKSVSMFTCSTGFVTVPKCCVSYTAFPLPVIVWRICLVDNFEKLSMLLGFSRDILEGWVRGCCVHGFQSLKNAVWQHGVRCVVDQTLLRLLKSGLKQINLVLLFFSLVFITHKLFTSFEH